MKEYLIRIFTLLIIALVFNACASKPTHIELVVKSSNDLNLDINKVPSPLMLTFYELESAENFLKFDYWTLLSDSGKNLNSDLISQSKNIIIPNQEQIYKILFEKNTKFLGIVGQFRDIQNSEKWKEVINLKTENYNYYEIKLNNNKIEK